MQPRKTPLDLDDADGRSEARAPPALSDAQRATLAEIEQRMRAVRKRASGRPERAPRLEQPAAEAVSETQSKDAESQRPHENDQEWTLRALQAFEERLRAAEANSQPSGGDVALNAEAIDAGANYNQSADTAHGTSTSTTRHASTRRCALHDVAGCASCTRRDDAEHAAPSDAGWMTHRLEYPLPEDDASDQLLHGESDEV